MANTILIEVELDETGVVRGLNSLEGEARSSGKKAGDNLEKEISKGTKKAEESVESLGDELKALANTRVGLNAITAGLAILAGGLFVTTRAAIAQEAAVSRLNEQLKLNGELTEDTASDLVNYSRELQSVSEFSDEVILAQIALAKSFGATNDQAKQVASVAIDLAKSFGISLESATRLASKTLGGYAGELGELIPELKILTQEQLRAGQGVDLLEKRFDGAGKNLGTFSFTLTQAGNSFGDLLEEFGKFTTENRFFIGAIQSSIRYLDDFAGGLRGIRTLLGFETPAVTELGKIDQEIAKNVASGQELRKEIEKLEKSLALVNLDGTTTALANARIEQAKNTRSLAKLINKRKELIALQRDAEGGGDGGDKRLTNAQLFAQAAIQTEEQIIAAAQKRQEAIEQLRERDLISKQGFIEAEAQIEQQKQDQLAAIRQRAAERQIEQTRSLTDAIQNGLRTQETSFVQLGKTVSNVAIRGFGNAFQNIGRALASGENASQAFVDTVKSTVADLASSFGDYYIARGIAASADPLQGGPAVGGPLIAAGVGLKVLSGLLGASASSGSGGTASEVSNIGGGLDAPVATAEPEQEEQVVNQIIVQGDVFDSEETGLRLFEIISDQSEKNGNVIIGGAFA